MLKKTKEFFKKSWGWFLLVPAGILGLVVLFWKNGKDWFKLLLAVRESSQLETKEVRDIREKEIEEQRKNKEKIDKVIEQMRLRHEKEDVELDESKKKQVDELLKSYNNDPDKLTDELAKVTGFKIILPPED
jgi:hypothetical protein